MNIQKFLRLAALALVGASNLAQAADFTARLPGDTVNFTTTVGSVFDANIYVNNAADFAGFNFTLTYDSSKLTALAFTSATVFGAPNTDILSNSVLPGSLNLSEAISLSSPLTAGIVITTPTLLATVHFRADAVNLNNFLNFDPSDFACSTFNGDSCAAINTAQGANVTIKASAVPVPASGALMLLSVSICGLLRQGARRRRPPGNRLID